MKNYLFTLLMLITVNSSFAQQTQYNVTPGDGNGLRFWNSNNYKLHMGNVAENHYGPVTDYSIKMNMNNNAARGWTWGVIGVTPIAALNTQGNMQIAGSFRAHTLNINGSILSNAGNGVLKVKTTYGYIDVGAKNSSWAHIYTDLPKIIFNKDVYTTSNAFSSYDNDLILKTKGTERLRIMDENGNIGVGTTNPDSKLTVKGKIHAEEVKIDLSVPAPDYVFTKEYNLLSIEEVQRYIEDKGHLPNIPSAKIMEAEGVELGAMNMKLLEKIEELTLYTIAQEKRIKELEYQNNKIKALEEKLERLVQKN